MINKMLKFSLAAFFLLAFVSFKAFSQNIKTPPEQKIIKVYVNKQENGKTVIIDTTIVTNDKMDAEPFVRDLNISPNEKVRVVKRIKRANLNAPDSISREMEIMVMDTIAPRRPQWKNFNEPTKSPEFYGPPAEGDKGIYQRPEPPFLLFDDQRQRIEIDGNTFLLTNPEKVVIEKKKKGKKVTLYFK